MVITATRPEDVLEVCDSVAVLRDGVLAWSGDETAAAALASPQHADAVRVRVEILDRAETSFTLVDDLTSRRIHPNWC